MSWLTVYDNKGSFLLFFKKSDVMMRICMSLRSTVLESGVHGQEMNRGCVIYPIQAREREDPFMGEERDP